MLPSAASWRTFVRGNSMTTSPSPSSFRLMRPPKLASFVFNAAPQSGTFDTLHDFASGSDNLTFSNAAFAALSPAGDPAGHVLASDFHLGTVAAAATDHLIYDQAHGKLFYDPDGTGAVAQVLFLTLTAGIALTATDLLLIG